MITSHRDTPLHQSHTALRQLTDQGLPRAVFLLLATAFCINIAFIHYHPIVWLDEVSYADPAIRFTQGKGFTSGIWYEQSLDELWAGNTPLHTLALIPGLLAAGTSLKTVRAIVYAEWMVAVLLLASGAVRLRLTDRRGSVFLTLALVLGFGASWSYRSARPDAVGFLVMSAGFWLASYPRTYATMAGIAVCGALVPLAGLQLLPYMAICCTGALFCGPYFRPAIASAGAGAAIGTAAMLEFYREHGVLGPFLRSTIMMQSSARTGLAGAVLRTLNHCDDLLLQDPSFTILWAAFAALTAYAFTRREKNTRTLLLLFAWASATPLLLSLAGKYPIYYSWMAYVQITLAWAHAIKIQWGDFPQRIRLTVIAAFGIALAVGLPLRLCPVYLHRKERDHRPLMSWIESRGIQPGEKIFISPPFYYGPAIAGADVYSVQNNKMSAAELASVARMYIRQDEVHLLEKFPPADSWVLTGEYSVGDPSSELHLQTYRVAEYRRSDPD